jgi:hypothetical protein
MIHRLAAPLLAVATLAAAACSAAPSAPAAKPAPAAPSGQARAPASGSSAAAPAAAAPALPAAPEPLTYGYTSLGANQWALYVAESRGYLTEQKIAFDATSMGSAAAGVQALASGSLDMTNSNPDPLIRAVANGADLVFLAGTQNPPIYSLYGQRDLRTATDIRGKTVIVGGPKDVTVYLMDRMMAPFGIQKTDYDMVYAGGTPDRLRALQSGAVQAAILLQPFEFVARREGYTYLADTYDTVRNLPFSSFAVVRSWLGNEGNRERTIRFLVALYRGGQEVCDPSQKEAMIRILADKTGLSDEDARDTYALLVEEKRSVKCDLSLSADELQQVINYIVEMGDLPAPGPDPRRIVDPTYLEQAVARLRR